MVTEKKDEKKARAVQIKASTGAWWKSTTEDDAAIVPEAEKEKPPAKKPRKTRQKPAPKAKPVAVNQDVQETDTAPPDKGKPSAKAKVDVEPVSHDAQENAAIAAVKPKKRRAPRKPKKKEAPKDESVTAELEKTSGNTEVVTITGDVVALASVEQAAQEKEVAPAKEEKKSKSASRSRRGRRGRRKADAPSPQETEAGDEQPELDASEGDEPDDEDTSAGVDDSTIEEKDSDEESEQFEQRTGKKVCKLLINAEEPEECRLALLEDGRLESIHVSTVMRTQTKNNIYKARIVAIEPSLQAAFVEYGTEKNGFLPFGEIHPEYYKQNLSEDVAQLVENQQWKKLNITDVIEKGQEILAQVVKEEVGKKGANMTTFLSIPGRCVVLMPGSDSAGISRKISGEDRRSQLRDVMKAIDLPEGIGWIVRTASVDITQEVLQRDTKYLLKLWEDIKARGQEIQGVGLVYEDHQSILRFLREHFDPSIVEILVDSQDALEQVKAFVELLPKEQQHVKVRLHQGARPIFNQYSVEDQIESIYQPRVNLPSGGSIVIEPTEALVSIDVNSGSTSKGKNFEASIFQANMEAAAELARQLRLRDLGGLIVVDFIDMRNRKHILAVEKQLKTAMKKDKAKVDFTRISKFGLMQISRQKLGAPLEAGNYRQCEYCKGRGTVKSVEALALYYLRRIQTGASRKQVEGIECTLPLDVASYLLNHKRSEINEMESKYKVSITIVSNPDLKPMDHELVYLKAEKEGTAKKQA